MTNGRMPGYRRVVLDGVLLGALQANALGSAGGAAASVAIGLGQGGAEWLWIAALLAVCSTGSILMWWSRYGLARSMRHAWELGKLDKDYDNLYDTEKR